MGSAGAVLLDLRKFRMCSAILFSDYERHGIVTFLYEERAVTEGTLSGNPG